MTVREKRVLLTRLLAGLVGHATSLGYEVALDQVRRTAAEAAAQARRGRGIASSLHVLGLAADVLLYRGGRYLSRTEDHRPLGEWWEAQHPLARWGGRFGDGNHYSITHAGRR